MRSRILFLSQCVPFPPHTGVTTRTYHVLQELQRDFDVTLLAFSRREHQPDSTSLARAAAALRRELAEVMNPVPIDSDWSIAAKLRNHARSVVARKPYIFYEYGDARFGRELEEAVERVRPDLVHLDSMDLYRWLPLLPVVPTTCTHHSIESELLRLQADRFSNRFVRAYLMHQADLVEKVERRLAPRFDLNVMTSETDAERLRALARGTRTTVAPNGVDVDFFLPTPREKVVNGRVTFLGPTYMFPNRDAVDFFITDIWPLIRNRCTESTFHLIGKAPIDEKARFEAHPRVSCHGFVPDVRPHLAETACFVVPLRVGGGTRLKILNAWSMGKAIVSTSIGCEGLNAVDGRDILIRDDPGGFAEAVIKVLSDTDLREHLGHEARKTAEKHYGWRAVGRKLTGSYHELIGSGASGTATN